MQRRKLSSSSSNLQIQMPRSYCDHAFAKQIRFLVDEEVLQDTQIHFRLSGGSVRVSAFLLSLVSPVFHKMVCGCFKERANKQLELEDVEEWAFSKVLDLACGREYVEARHLGDAVELARLADRFQMSEIVSALEDFILQHLTVERCADILNASVSSGLSRVEGGCRALALANFEEVSRTAGFVDMREDTLGSLLEDDRLVAESEERVFEAVAEWMRRGPEGPRGQELVRKIRFPQMDGEYLATRVRWAVPESQALTDVLMESSLLKHVTADRRDAVVVTHLSPRALEPRIGKGVAWERYVAGGGERRLAAHSDFVYSVAECAGRVCSGSGDGYIRVWDPATLREERVMHAADVGVGVEVWSLASWGGLLVSGHIDGRLRVWDTATGRCERVISGHTGNVYALAVWGDRLVSGSNDKTVRVWGMSARVAWPCEKTLVGHGDLVLCLAVWRGKVLSGSGDRTVRVWDGASGAAEARLPHGDWVRALAVHRGRVYSSADDGVVRVWAAGTWELLQSVDAFPSESRQCGFSLAVSGGRLVAGAGDRDGSYEDGVFEVRVWELCAGGEVRGGGGGGLVLPQPEGAQVWALAAVGGEVWGGVGEAVVVWGRPS